MIVTPADINITFALNSSGPQEQIFISEVTVTGLHPELW